MQRALVNLLINAKGFFVYRRERILDSLIVSGNNQRIVRRLGSSIARVRSATPKLNGVAGLGSGGAFIGLAGSRSLANYRADAEGGTAAKNEDSAQKA
jgi:hypothetical protein